MEAMPPALADLPRDQIALKPFNLVGLAALHQLLVGCRAVRLVQQRPKRQLQNFPAHSRLPRWSTRSPPMGMAW